MFEDEGVQNLLYLQVVCRVDVDDEEDKTRTHWLYR